MPVTTADGIEILGSIDALDGALEAKKTTKTEYIIEKSNLQTSNVTIETITLPKLRVQKTSLEATHTKNQNDYQDLVDDAYDNAYGTDYGTAGFNVAQGKLDFDRAKDKADTAVLDALAEQSKWKGWYENGCKSNYGSFEGAYCGKRSVGCANKSKGNFDTLAPSRCLKSQYRDSRNNHARSMVGNTAVAVSNAKTAQTKAYEKPTYLTNAENNVASAKLSYAEMKAVICCKTSAKAVSDKMYEISGYVRSNGVLEMNNKRIAFIDGKVSKLDDEITTLDREKLIAEQAYQEFINETKAQNAIVENADATAEAKRKAEAELLDLEIDQNRAELERTENPEYRAELREEDKTNKLFILGGISILIAGIYFLKKK